MSYIYISTYMFLKRTHAHAYARARAHTHTHTHERMVLEVYKNLVKYRSDNNFVEPSKYIGRSCGSIIMLQKVWTFQQLI